MTLYVGPKAPKGYENNWIPSAGKTPYFVCRFHGPGEVFYNKTSKLKDVELVKSRGGREEVACRRVASGQ